MNLGWCVLFCFISTPSGGASDEASSPYAQDPTASFHSTSTLAKWTKFAPSTLDYLLIDSNVSTMSRHLRSEKISLWNELVPSMDERLRRLKLEASLSPTLTVERSPVLAGDGSVTSSVITDKVWVLAAICVLQTGLLLLVAVLLTRSRKKYRKLKRQVVAKI